MENKTPIQEAIAIAEAKINKIRDRNDFEAGIIQGLERAKDILESLLPKEKEFVGKIHDEAARGSLDLFFKNIEKQVVDNPAIASATMINLVETVKTKPFPIPDKQQFLNQLYPEK